MLAQQTQNKRVTLCDTITEDWVQLSISVEASKQANWKTNLDKDVNILLNYFDTKMV